MKTLMALSLLLFSLSLFAGTQRSFEITDTLIELVNGKLVGSGVVKGKEIRQTFSNLIVSGEIMGDLCGLKTKASCTSRLVTKDHILTMSIDVDSDQDGNIDNRVNNVEVGRIAGNSLDFNVPTKLLLVQDRYSFLEKLSGLKDRDYLTLIISVEVW